jgi:hypothetical protein
VDKILEEDVEAVRSVRLGDETATAAAASTLAQTA